MSGIRQPRYINFPGHGSKLFDTSPYGENGIFPVRYSQPLNTIWNFNAIPDLHCGPFFVNGSRSQLAHRHPVWIDPNGVKITGTRLAELPDARLEGSPECRCPDGKKSGLDTLPGQKEDLSVNKGWNRNHFDCNYVTNERNVRVTIAIQHTLMSGGAVHSRSYFITFVS
jgi:hypothetical protein